jgi:hypothetical protein
MKAKRKWLLAGIALALVLAGALAAPFFIDEPPPDDADLRVAVVEVPREENGFWLLDVKNDDIRLPASTNRKHPLELLRLFATGKEWDPATAREILEKNAAVLEKLDASLRLARFQVADMVARSEAGQPLLPIDLPPLQHPWAAIGYLGLIRMQALVREGKSAEALDQAWAVATLGQRLQAGGGRMIEVSIGRSTETAALTQLRKLVRRHDLDRDIVLPLARRLQAFSSRRAAEVHWKGWYEFTRSWLDPAIENGAIKVFATGTPAIWKGDLCLKPNETRRLLADAARALIANQGNPGSWRDSLEALAPPPRLLSWLPHPNTVGRSAVRSILSSVEDQPYVIARADLERAFTAALMALECWKARHGGALPPTLDALVPEYLDAVPLDPYDGKPLRYSAEKKIAYSVGGDGTDSGGSQRTDEAAAFDEGKEPTLRIESPPPGG